MDTASSASSSHLMWRTVWLLAQTLDDNPLQLQKCWFGMSCRGERRNGNRRWWRGGGGEVVCRVRSVRRPASCDAGPGQQATTISNHRPHKAGIAFQGVGSDQIRLLGITSKPSIRSIFELSSPLQFVFPLENRSSERSQINNKRLQVTKKIRPP